MKRRAYLRLRERYRRRGKFFVYADESGFEQSVTRRYGRAPKGEKVYGLRSGHSRPRTSLIAARFENGGFEAPILFEGTCNTDIFNMWLEQHLCPLLNDTHVVVIDNAAFHKSAASKTLIEKTGATLLFLPPYSPDFNPIENDFANLKTIREYDENNTIDNIITVYN